MKLKHIALIGSLFPILFSLVLFFGVLISADSDDENSNFSSGITGMNLSAEVLKHQPMVEKYARENGISEYVNVLLAIIQVESGGTAEDVMQSSESLGLPPNSLDTESSIKQGCKYFASLLSSCQNQGIDDLNVAIQSYNYGGGYVGYVAGKGKKYTFNLAESFAREKSGGKKVTYTNPIAVAKNGGWRYGYGNMFYVELVNQYLTVPQVSGELAQKVMNEALKYQGWKYVYGGSNPNTSFDCSGLTQWCYGKAGISLPRTAQAQYDATQHLPLSQAKAGDLVFFHSTYNAGTYVTHVAIYVGNNQIYHAGDPIGYADLSSSYWQQHLIGKEPKEKKVRTVKVGTHKKTVIALWVVLVASVSFGVYKNFTAIDQHTTHEKEIIELRLQDTNGIENFVKNFAKSYYTWDNSKEAIEARTQAISGYLTKELQDLNVDTIRTDIPTSSTVTDVIVWHIEQSGTDTFSATYEVDQQIKEGEQTSNVTATYTVKVHVDADGDMVIVQNPTLAPAIEKSDYEPKTPEADASVDADTVNDATAFLETFFKLYPTATEKELAYYVSGNVLEPIGRDYLYSELVNPIFTKDGDNVKVKVGVKFLDNQTKATQISQYELVLHKDSNWKIVG